MNKQKIINFLPPFVRQVYCKIKSSNLIMRMARGTFWMFTGSALGKFFVLIAGIVVANILGKEQYGELGLVRSTINMFVVMGTAGLGVTATKYIAEFKNTNKGKCSSIYLLTNGFALLTGLVIMLIVFFIAPWLAKETLNAPHLVNELRLGALLLFIAVINSAQLGVLSGFEDFKASALTTLYASLAEFVFMILGAFYYGVMGALLGYGIGYVVMTISYFLFIRNDLRINVIPVGIKYFQIKDLEVVYKFSIPAALSSLMVGPVFWVVRTILVNTSDGYGELGIYEAADQWRIIILFIPSAITGVLLPLLTNTLSINDKDSYWKVLKYNIIINASVSFALATIILFCSKWIMGMYGDGFDDVWTLVIVSYSTVFTSIASVVGISIVSRGKMWIGFCFNVLWACLFIGMTYLFINKGFGATGVAWALLFSYLLHALFQGIYAVNLMRKNGIK